ncbi:MAG: hypothetical protein RLZZ273_1541 [Bacteroidota bacterium]
MLSKTRDFLLNRLMKMPRCSASAVAATVVICLMLGTIMQVSAQGMLHEGQHFLAGFIHPERAPGEPLSKDAYRIIVASRFAARAIVAGKEVSIQPNAAIEVVIDSCDVALVTSDKPITVSTRVLMQGNGEQATQIPTFAWGTRYRAFTWWTDRYGIDTKHYAYAKRLVIARENNTVVRITGKSGLLQVKLNAGECSYVPFYLDTAYVRDTASDLTGEYFNANKPIMVISGHGKTAVLEHPDALPASGPYARPANRTRGTLMESMIPVEHAGTSFVTVPFQYSPTRKRGQDNSKVGIADDRGDVIRFIGTTTPAVLSYKTDTGDVIVDTIGEGEVYTARSVETARLWNASRQVLCAHYGKSYGHITSQATLPEDDPSTDAGLPMLVSIPSTNQWTSHATFTCPQDLINYVTIVARQEHIGSLYLDGKSISSTMNISPIPGSDYACARAMVGTGSHKVTTTSNDATFMTLTYGNLDGLQLCNAYASTCGISLQHPCMDSLDVATQLYADSANITFTPVALDACNEIGIAMLYEASSYNCTTTIDGSIAHIKRLNPTDSAYAVVRCVTLHGSTISRRVWFDATTGMHGRDSHTSTTFVHPNPCHSILSIECTKTDSECGQIQLHDVFGAIHRDGSPRAQSHQFDVSTLMPGTYLLIHGMSTIPITVIR